MSRLLRALRHHPVASVVTATLLSRLALLAYFLQLRRDIFLWRDYECGFIAANLAQGRGFTGGFHDYSAPTSWFAPAYPLVLSSLFRVFGPRTFASAVAAYGVNILLAILTAVLILKIGSRLCNPATALAAGLIWGLAPQAAMPEFVISDTTLAAMLMCLAMAFTLLLSPAGTKLQWFLGGVVWGLSALASPATLAPIPLVLLYVVKKNPNLRWKPVLLVLAIALTLAPWTIRNAAIFHRFVPVRDNGLAEIYFANAGYDENPSGGSMEYQRLGEEKFVSMIEHKLVAYVRTHPLEFVKSSVVRVFQFWTAPDGPFGYTFALSLLALLGLLLLVRKSWLDALPFLAVMGLYPLVYYMSVTFSHYRQPVEPFLYILAAYALVEITGYMTRGSSANHHAHKLTVSR